MKLNLNDYDIRNFNETLVVEDMNGNALAETGPARWNNTYRRAVRQIHHIKFTTDEETGGEVPAFTNGEIVTILNKWAPKTKTDTFV